MRYKGLVLSFCALAWPTTGHSETPSATEVSVSATGGVRSSDVVVGPAYGAFDGDEPFVGRSPRRTVRSARLEIGVEGQMVPLNIVLSTSRSSLVQQGIALGCANSPVPDCVAQAQSVANQAIAVIDGLSDAALVRVEAAAANPSQLAATPRAVGVTDPTQIKAVTDYIGKMPLGQRAAALALVCHVVDNQAADMRLEPFARLELPAIELRLGLPMSLGVSSGPGARFALGDLNLDAKVGWNFPGRHATFGIAVGLGLYLPTGSRNESPAVMADLFQASKYLRDYLTASPYVATGVDLKWVALEAYGEVAFQNRLRGSTGPLSVQYLQYGTGLTLVPRFPISLVGELNGFQGIHNGAAYRSLFVVGGIRIRVWRMHLAVAAQIPVWDGAQENLGSYAGLDVGRLARYTILTRLSAAF